MEGYKEIEVKHPKKIIKSCDNCKHVITYQESPARTASTFSICDFDFEGDKSFYDRALDKIHLVLENPFETPYSIKDINTFLKPLGVDGEGCPFHKQILREKNLNKLIKYGTV